MPRTYLHGAFLRVTLANFFFFLNFASFFLLPLYVKQIGGDESVVGLVMGTTGGCSLLFIPVVGWLIDRHGRRTFLLLGAAGMTVAACLFPLVDGIGVLIFALRLLQGISFACAFTATTTFAAALAPSEQRARALGIFGLSTILTHAIAPSLGEEVIRRAGFATLFNVAAVYSVVSFVLALRLPPAPLPSVAAARISSAGIPMAQRHVAMVTALAAMGFGTVMTFIAVFVTSHGLGRAAYFFGAYTSTAILVRFVGAGLSDRLGRKQVIVPGLIGLGLSIALIASAYSIVPLVVAGMVFGASQGISYPTLHALIVDLSEVGQLGRTQALFNGAYNLGVTAGSFAFGYVAEHAGYRPMFCVAALMPIAGSLLLAMRQMPAATVVEIK